MNGVGPSLSRIVKRDGTIVQFDRERIQTAILKAMRSLNRADPPLAAGLALQVEQALVNTYGATMTPTVEDIQDVVESVLMEHKLVDVARDYIIYRHQRALARAARANLFEVTDNVPYRALYEVLRWNINHGCDSVAGINQIIASGQFPTLVKDSDARYKMEVESAAVRILEHIENIRIVIVAGPSSSGKTTTTIKISEKLQSIGVAFKAINIDHYFFDLEQHPKDEFGDYDYETPAALDLDLINLHLEQLLEGKTIRTPHYDFKTGHRDLDVHAMELKPNEVLLIDSLHGLYDRMTQRIPAENKFKLYIETLGQLRTAEGGLMRWADNRLLRRMIRDKTHRNLRPIQTLTHWHYVRRSELKYIIPYIKHTDCIVNSALPYELPVLRSRLFRTIATVINRYATDPKRLDAHIRANRVCDLLRPLTAVKDDTCIPSDSLLREFIGGSRYRY